MLQEITPKVAEGQASNRYQGEYSDAFVEQLDAVIDWDARARSEGSFLIDRLREQGADKVLDASCGTGFHAVQLAKAGFSVVASDGVAAMVHRAKQNFRKHGLSIAAHVCDWRDIDRLPGAPFDALLCLGNSLSHLFEASARREVLSRFHDVLRPGGLLIADHRNYEALSSKGRADRPQSYCCCAAETSVRLEVVGPDLVRIHYRYRGEEVHHLDTYPLSRGQLQADLAWAGFESLSVHGDGAADNDAARAEFWIQAACRP